MQSIIYIIISKDNSNDYYNYVYQYRVAEDSSKKNEKKYVDKEVEAGIEEEEEEYDDDDEEDDDNIKDVEKIKEDV